jgi:hypothetical protein
VLVKRSTKAGIASVALLLSILIPPYAEWRAPINVACVTVSCALGLLASGAGRRWWLIIPGCIVTGFALLLYLAIALP